ncbi:alpha/beta fold hydrolase [Bacteroidota bacterium]
MKSDNRIDIQVNSHIEHKILEQKGYSIHYFISGKNPNDLIMFLHPAFGNHRCFDKQIDFFSENYRVITLDFLGHGLSQPGSTKDKIDISLNHIQKIMENERYDNAHFVGVSMGSLIAQYMALKNPDMVKSITILGGYDINSDNRKVMKAQKAEGVKWIFKALYSMKSFRRYVASVTVVHDEEKARFYEMASLFTRRSFRVMSGLGKIIQPRDNVQHNYPLLVMTGDQDLELIKKVAEDWKKNDPCIEFQIIPNAGHCANMDNADSFNAILADFLVKDN